MNPICFYHKADLDGVCSAAIVKHFVPDCELYGIDYGDEFPWGDLGVAYIEHPDTGEILCKRVDPAPSKENAPELRTTYMVDFSLPPEDMKRLAKVSNLIWIDHHKTCEDLWNEINPLGMFRTNRAACELTWEWMSLHVQGDHDARQLTESLKESPWREICPEAVRLLGRYDIWDKDNPEWDSKVMPFQYGMRAYNGVYDPTSKCWETLLAFDGAVTHSGHSVSIIDAGDAILRFQVTQNQRIAEAGAFELDLPEFPIVTNRTVPGLHKPEEWVPIRTDARTFRCVCLNTPLNNSSSFDSVWNPEKHDIMVAFALMASGKWKVSLYSTKPDIDCGALCKTFGGGGHRGAAGFMCDRLPWDGEQ